MNFTKIKTISSIVALIIASASYAGNIKWRINKDHSEIKFNVKYLEVASVDGRFEKFGGVVTFDQDLELINEINIVIMSSSVTTSNPMRDNHLRSTDFLDSKNNPRIIFQSHDIEVVGPHKYKANGELKLLNIKKEISFNFTLSKNIKDTWGYENRFVEFEGAIDRRVFGLEWEKMLAQGNYLVGNTVKIFGQFQIQPLNALTPASKYMIPNTKEINRREQGLKSEFTDVYFDDDEIEKEGNNDKAKVVIKDEIQKPKELKQEVSTKPYERPNAWWMTSYIIVWLVSICSTLIYTPIGTSLFKTLRPENNNEAREIKTLLRILAVPLAICYIASMMYLGWGNI